MPRPHLYVTLLVYYITLLVCCIILPDPNCRQGRHSIVVSLHNAPAGLRLARASGRLPQTDLSMSCARG
jgi:hypothetical protein